MSVAIVGVGETDYAWKDTRSPAAWQEVATTGVVHTATRVERAFLPGGHADVPYVVAFVELDGVDGVRLVANLADDTAVSIGDRVQAAFVDVDDRRHLVFVPA